MKHLIKIYGFVHIKTNTLNIIIKKEWADKAFIKLLEYSPTELEQIDIITDKLSTVPSTTVIKVQYNQSTIYFKFFHLIKNYYKVKAMIRKTKAERALYGSLLLKMAGLKTPEVIAIAHKPGLKKISHILIVTKEVKGIVLSSYLREYQIPNKERNQLAYKLGKDIAKMHKNFIIHGDLHPGNILLTKENISKFFYLDTEHVRNTYTRFNKYMLKDLALLNHPNLGCFTKRDRLIFIRSYFKAMRNNISMTLQELIEQIHILSNKKYTKKQ